MNQKVETWWQKYSVGLAITLSGAAMLTMISTFILFRVHLNDYQHHMQQHEWIKDYNSYMYEANSTQNDMIFKIATKTKTNIEYEKNNMPTLPFRGGSVL